MLPNPSGSFRLFRAFGVQVFVHWSWVLVAFLVVQLSSRYTSPLWAWAEYLALFVIVLLHEFGHALACRSVGGKAERIVLWPLGGVAYVQPPMRPGAFLWSIAAGPLVNLVLFPVTFGLWWAAHRGDLPVSENATAFFQNILWVNLVLFVFNMMPIYPLDGGQILHSILWFFVGFARSLRVAAVVGLAVALLAAPFLLVHGEVWLLVMALFIGWRAWLGFQLANQIARAEAAYKAQHDPRREQLLAQMRGEPYLRKNDP